MTDKGRADKTRAEHERVAQAVAPGEPGQDVAAFYLAAIVESSDDAIIGKTLDGTITSWNRAAERLYGYTAEEVIGRSISIIIPPERSGEFAEIMRTLAAGRRADHLETVRRRKDGTLLNVSLTVSPIRNARGELVGASALARDITDMFEVRRALERSEQSLREADRRKDEFLATLAHELRNPLAPIRNTSELLRIAGDDPEQRKRALDVLDPQVRQMVRLIDDLMDVSRISRGRIELRKQRMSLTTAIDSALETSRPLIDAAGHELTVDLPAEPLWVDGDTTRLAQVFANLLNNAAKYTERGRIGIIARCEGERAIVSVRDSGIGIAAEALPHIFEMFAQVDRSLERAQGGLGIGLSLVRALVEMHGGTVEAHSDGKGKGSELVVALPLLRGDAPAERASEPADKPPLSRHKCRILVVDDNADSADSLAAMLEMLGHDVCIAYDGLAAIDEAVKFDPAVVLLDIGLPELNGYEVARRIRREKNGSKMLLIAMTGWGQDEDKDRATEAGFDLHMTKPLDPMALERVLDDHVRC
jgi:PAS domain S-box-containing protein